MRSRHWLSALSGACAFFCVIAYAKASGVQGSGLVTLNGSITETPCAIDTQSRDQSIDLGATPIGVMARDGQGKAHPFHIHLVNCQIARLDPSQEDWRYFQVTFEGSVDRGFFGLSGDARGVALMLTDSSGRIAHPGEPLLPGELSSAGEQTLDYTLRLVGNQQRLLAGDFRTTLRFRMNYY